jgi:hypothetical protein
LLALAVNAVARVFYAAAVGPLVYSGWMAAATGVALAAGAGATVLASH